MMDEFQQTFFDDARDLLKQLEQALLTLESDPEDSQIIEEIFRVMHTIKGAGNMFGFEVIGDFTHNIETIYDAIRNKEAVVDEVILNLTFQSVDHIHALLDDPHLEDGVNKTNHHSLNRSIEQVIETIEASKGTPKGSGTLLPEVAKEEQKVKNGTTYYLIIRPLEPLPTEAGHPLILVIDDLKEQGKHKITEHLQKPLSDPPVNLYWDMYLYSQKTEEEIRNTFIFVEDECELQIFRLAEYDLLNEEKFVSKAEEFAEEETPVDIPKLQTYVNTLLEEIRTNHFDKLQEKEEASKQQAGGNKSIGGQSASIRVSTDKIDQLMNWVSELVTMQATIQSIAGEHKLPNLYAAAENMEVISNNLRDTVFSISLLPLETMTVKLKRLIRKLNSELGKNVELRTEGADTELDKNVIEALTDPLMHILRNSMDHGLETAEEREKAGKPAQGYILLKAYYSGASVFIEIHDDGRGIDPVKVRNKAVEKGLIDKDAELSQEETYQLLFMPGFSTAAQLTDVSGRGVGMDVVRKKIWDVRGDVSIYSELGQGTSISIRLPLTLSIVDGLLTQVDNTFFVFPLNLVSRINKTPYEEVKKDGNFSRSIVVEGEQMSVLSLREAFGMHDNYPEQATIVSIQDGRGEKGIVVDRVRGELQAVLKPLGNMYEEQDYISGSTILGDGNLALVLDTNKLISRYVAEEKTH